MRVGNICGMLMFDETYTPEQVCWRPQWFVGVFSIAVTVSPFQFLGDQSDSATVPQTLPPVSVTSKLGKPARLAYTHKFDEFYARRARGPGIFITREQIDSAFKATTPELLQMIPGVFIRQELLQWRIQFPRCGGARSPRRITRGGFAPTELVAVFVDGQYMQESTDELSEINPAQIEAIEVYKGPSELPADARGRGCGAIYLWLRNGR